MFSALYVTLPGRVERHKRVTENFIRTGENVSDLWAFVGHFFMVKTKLHQKLPMLFIFSLNSCVFKFMFFIRVSFKITFLESVS
jgi:hypothetical protein